MQNTFRILLTAIVLLSTDSVIAADKNVAVKDLRCEYLVNPLGIDVTQPRLSWIIETDKRNWSQSAYQILVATSAEKLKQNKADLWDSGKVKSDQSIHVVYDGKPLNSRVRCWWKLRVWDKDGKVSSYSSPAWWEMGLLHPKDWQAKWISAPLAYDWAGRGNMRAETRTEAWEDINPSPFFRRTFVLEKPVQKARVYICGLGYNELYVNGEKTGDNVLDPAFTRYDKRVLYTTYDITDQLQKGENVVGVILGNGWYNQHTRDIWYFERAAWIDNPTMLCRLEVQFTDRTSKVITGDSTWKVNRGPIVFDGIRNGEFYDARLERPGWCGADYDDSDWHNARIARGPAGKLVAQMMPPIKVTKTIKPVKITEPLMGYFVFDLGQNIAGWAQLKVEGPVGTKITMKYGERIDRRGMLDRNDTSRFVWTGPVQTDTYTLKGQGTEIWEPRFVYHGFRYVQVTGFPGKPTLDNLRGRVVHTSFESAGSFECSNQLLNKIQQCTIWSYIGNFHGYPTDCPQREKCGWAGDGQLAAVQGLYNFNSASAYTKWMNDFKDEQRDDGDLPGIIPTAGWGYSWNSPAWCSAYILIPWHLYQYCGDIRILQEHYDRQILYLDMLKKKDLSSLTHHPGNWQTVYYYADAVIISRIAELLGKTADAEKYARLAENIKQSLNQTLYKGDGLYGKGEQPTLICAMDMGMVPEKEKTQVLNQIAADIESNDWHKDWHNSNWYLITKHLLHALTDNGRIDVAYRFATKTTYPSYGYWIKQGATTLWENWEGKKGSRNHIFYGDISAWFYKALAGINPDPAGPGFKKIIIRPRPVGDLTWVKAEHKSMYGTIASSWRIVDGDFLLDIAIPANTTATVYVPADGAKSVTESGRGAAKSLGLRFLRTEDRKTVFEVGSGHYRFKSTLPK